MRGRPRKVIPSTPLTVRLPMDLKAKIDLVLFSEVEGRIPQGAHQEFFTTMIKEFLASETLDLAIFIPHTQPGTAVVRGPVETIQQLKRILET